MMAKRTSLASLGASLGSDYSFDNAKDAVVHKGSENSGVVEQGTDGMFLPDTPVDDLIGSPRNPRDQINDLDDLKTIVDQQYQPGLAVTRMAWLAVFPGDVDAIGEAKYVVVNGNRRLAAARKFGRPGLDIVIRDSVAIDEAAIMRAALLENLARQDLDVIEEAKAVEALVQTLPSATAAAEMLGYTSAWVSQRRSLLKLAPELQEKLRAGELGIREARSLTKVPREDQVNAWLDELNRRENPAPPEPEVKPDEPNGNEKDNGDRSEVTPVEKIVKALKGAKADPETTVAALEEFFDAADLLQLKALIG